MIISAVTLDYYVPPTIVLSLAQAEVTSAREVYRPAELSAITSKYGRFSTHFEKLTQIRRDSKTWPDRAEGPTEQAINWAKVALEQLRITNTPPTRIVASGEGGAALCFVEGEKYADIESLNSGVILGVISQKGGRPIAWEIEPSASGIAGAVNRILSFIDG